MDEIGKLLVALWLSGLLLLLFPSGLTLGLFSVLLGWGLVVGFVTLVADGGLW